MKRTKKQKLVVICGPTASGKSSIALTTAQQYNGILISADSRQIYRDFDIGTGKEVAKLRSGQASKEADGWIIDGVPVFGYDICSGHDRFSAYDFAVFARQRIVAIENDGKRPIIVGGTGLYSKLMLNGVDRPAGTIPDDIREDLDQLSVTQLQSLLTILDTDQLATMNQSDRQNPRRLQRRIASYLTSQVHVRKLIGTDFSQLTSIDIPEQPQEPLLPLSVDVLQIGLTAPDDILRNRVATRVAEMMTLGLAEEVSSLLKKGYTFSDPAFLAIGYQEFKPFFSGKASLADVESAIVLHTLQYIKRQQTWFKSNTAITWFDITDSQFQQKLNQLVAPWYNSERPV